MAEQSLFYETHATSLDNEAGLASGWYDVDLSATGVTQARELGRRYAHGHLHAVFCSDLLRARRSADIAFGGSGVTVVIDRRLRECDYGELTRKPVGEIERLRLAAVESAFPGGESYTDVTARVADWLRDLGRRPELPILVIGHRATFYAFEHLLKGVPLADAVAAPWRWQPGWRYVLREDIIGRPSARRSSGRPERSG